MKKTKQATLFSLKSWKNVAADNIQKYKEILANRNKTEFEILNALVSLKRKNPSRDVILASKIDVSLELLEKHPSAIVCEEARFLRKYWQLNKNISSEVILIDGEPPSKKQKMLPITEIHEINTAEKRNTELKVRNLNQIHEKHPSNDSFLMNNKKNEIKPMKNQPIEIKVQSIKQIQEKRLASESFLKNTMEVLSPGTNMQSKIWLSTKPTSWGFSKDSKESGSAIIIPTPTVSKSSSVSRATYNSVMRQLCDAVRLFTQELGEQEVRFYLEKQ